jgi:D-xylose transport system ATP-binding protein
MTIAPDQPLSAPARGSTDPDGLLVMRGISKSFGSVQALTEVDFDVRSGEVMALVGDNGAGKSTLIKCVAGIHPYDAGEVFFAGQEVSIHSPKDAAALGIEVVYQDLALCDNLDVVQNMYLGREATDAGSRSSTRTSRCATTSTSSRTCTSGARPPTRSSGSRSRRWRRGRPRR